jgi:hypothetical protein
MKGDYPIKVLEIAPLIKVTLLTVSSFFSTCGLPRPVVFIHYPHSNPHPSQMGRVWVENYYPLKKWVGWVWGGYK